MAARAAGYRRANLAIPTNLMSRIIAVLAFGILAAWAPSPARAGAEPDSRIRIAFAGDSIVDNYWSGMTRVIAANACLKTSVDLGRFARNGTGLTRGDKLYWPREIRRIGETFRPHVFVLSIGLNDRQFIVDAAGVRTPWGAPDWTDRYRAQIVEFLKGAAESKATVLLVGLPAMRDGVSNADAQEKNAMFAAAVAALGAGNVQYLEPWRLKPSGAETFSSYGPDHGGRMVQIRTVDGEHFTVAGEDLAAAYLYPKIVTALDHAGLRPGSACESADKGSTDKGIADKDITDKGIEDKGQ
jgi:hypothetical protein